MTALASTRHCRRPLQRPILSAHMPMTTRLATDNPMSPPAPRRCSPRLQPVILTFLIALVVTACATTNRQPNASALPCHGSNRNTIKRSAECPPSDASVVATVAPAVAQVTPTTVAQVTPTTAATVHELIPERDFAETGPGTGTFTITLSATETAVFGGYSVDGVDHGVYRMRCGPGTFTTTITDGFFVAVPSARAQEEFQMRLNQADQHKYARDHIVGC